MKELSLHILDLAENSIAAGASQVEIEIQASRPRDELVLAITDNGRGMERAVLARISDPFVTSRTTRKVGLGIPLLKAAAESCNGRFDIESGLGLGTHVIAAFQLSHIDRMPLGDLESTLLTLLVAHSDVNWIIRYQVESSSEQPLYQFDFDDKEIKNILGDLPLSHPDVLAFLEYQLTEGINSVERIDELMPVQL